MEEALDAPEIADAAAWARARSRRLEADEAVGIAVDLREAVKWYTSAAEGGSVHVQFNLAACYENGEGTAVDEVKAFKWYTLAAEEGMFKPLRSLSAFRDRCDYLGKSFLRSLFRDTAIRR